MTVANDAVPTRGPREPVALDIAAFWLTAALLTLVFVLGGTSHDNDLSIMAMQLLSLPLLALGCWRAPAVLGDRMTVAAMILVGLVLVTPLLQLIPLPPQIWLSLPGREVVAETLRLADVSPGWAPLSLTPDQTLRSFFWLLPATAVFMSGISLDARRRVWLVGLILGLCIASLVLGGLQITDRDGGMFRPHQTTHALLPTGFFSNRNHQGIVMAASLPLAAVLALQWGQGSLDRRRLGAIIFVALVGILMVGVLITRSRAALALAGPSLLASFALFGFASIGRRPGRNMLIIFGTVLLLLVVLAQVALGAVISRFDNLADKEGRFEIWPTTLEAAGPLQPVGSGLGAFETVYRTVEPLNQLSPLFVNHAHNDYLELWLETGFLFPVLFVAFLAWFGKAMWDAYRRPLAWDLGLARAAGVVILVLLAHSVVDYPLRMIPLACLFAFAAAALTPARDPYPAPTAPKSRRSESGEPRARVRTRRRLS